VARCGGRDVFIRSTVAGGVEMVPDGPESGFRCVVGVMAIAGITFY